MGDYDFTTKKHTVIMDNLCRDIERYLKEFKEKMDISYIIKCEIYNFVFINFKAYTKDNVFIYQENLWCDYILEQSDYAKKREYLIDFAKSLLINVMNRKIFLTYKDILEG